MAERAPPCATCSASILGHITTGPCAGRRVARVGDSLDAGVLPSARCRAAMGGTVRPGGILPQDSPDASRILSS